MKKIICLILSLLFMFAFVGCGEKDSLDSIKEKGKIVISTSPDYAPWEFIDPSKTGQDQFVGADIELMKYIANKLGVELEIKSTDFDTTLALLQTGAVDLAISGFTYKPERAENYEMSISYDGEGSQGVLVLTENVATYKDLASLNVAGVKVAGQNGSLQADYVGQYLPNAELKKVTKISDGVLYLNEGEVKALAISSTAAESIIAQNPGKYTYLEETFPVPEEETQLFVLAQKGQKNLIEEINKILKEVVDNGLYKEWMEEAVELAEKTGDLE